MQQLYLDSSNNAKTPENIVSSHRLEDEGSERQTVSRQSIPSQIARRCAGSRHKE